MLLFIILYLLLAIPLTLFESDLTILTKGVRASPEIAFLFIAEDKSCSFRHSYSSNASKGFYPTERGFALAQIIFDFANQNQ